MFFSAMRLNIQPLHFNLFTLYSREYAAAEFPKLCFKATHKFMLYNLIPITLLLIRQSFLLLDIYALPYIISHISIQEEKQGGVAIYSHQETKTWYKI